MAVKACGCLLFAVVIAGCAPAPTYRRPSPTSGSAEPGSTVLASTPTPAAQTTLVVTPESTAVTTVSAKNTTPTPTPTSATELPTTTTAAVFGAEPAAGSVSAADLLAFIVVANEHRGGYQRDLFGYPTDANGDGCNTRDEMLKRDSRTPVVESGGCHIISGDWYSPYDDITVTDPTGIEIDHVVALKEAWDSGAWQWSPEQRGAYANDLSDPRTLRAVTTASNRAKGDKDPSNWLPPNPADVCAFIGDWVAIKARWAMTMDQSEYGRIRNLLNGDCSGLRVDNPSTPPITTVPGAASTPATPDTIGSQGSSTTVYYQSCAAARAARAAPLHVGDPGYRTGLDRDKDGIACE